MRITIYILLLSTFALARAEDTPVDLPDAELKEKVLRLIEQLGNDEFDVREKAEHALVALGPKAVAIISKLPFSTDAEVNVRLQRFRIQNQLEEAKTLAEVMALRKKFLAAENFELAAAALEKAKKFETPGELADALYQSSLAAYCKIKGAGHPLSALRQVERDLSLCVDCYDAHLKKHPEDKDAETRQTEASMILYGCRKYMSL